MSAESGIITVFGSSRPCEGHADYEQARALGRELALCGFRVCSGGYRGVMEAVSRGAKEAGGRTMAVTAEFFASKPNAWVDDVHTVSTWQERLFELIRLGNGFVACKGGTGTLVELAVVWEMLNKGVVQGKPFVTLGDFWVPIIERVREVEIDGDSRWKELVQRQVRVVSAPSDAAAYIAERLNGPTRGLDTSQSEPRIQTKRS
jgi:uncharacterized protein (TIGR00725 family)